LNDKQFHKKKVSEPGLGIEVNSKAKVTKINLNKGPLQHTKSFSISKIS